MKKIKCLNRIFAMAIATVLLIGSFSTSVFAAKEMFTTYQIDDVTITGIDAPEAGKPFDFTAEESSQKYNVIKVAWKSQFSDNYITDTSVSATAGTQYTVYVVLEVATADHYFSTDSGRMPAVSSVTVNGNTANASNSMDYSLFSVDASKYEHDTTYQKYLVVMYTFPETEAAPITSIDFNVPTLVLGQLIPTTWQASGISIEGINGNANNGQVSVNKIEWSLQDGTSLPGNSAFIFGQTYSLKLTLSPLYGASFATDPNHILSQPGKPFPAVTVTMNGKTATVLPTYDNYSNMYLVASCVFSCDTPSKIAKIDLTDIDAPVAGKAPDYTFTGGGGYEHNGRSDAYYKNGVCWSEVGGSYVLSDGTHAFLPNKAYQVDIRIKAKTGYEFATNSFGVVSTAVTVNGKSASVSGNKNEILITCEFPATGNLVIGKIGVTDIEPPAEESTPDYNVTYLNVNYGAANYNNATTKNGISWYNETDGKVMSTTDKFEAGKTYTVQITIWTNEGYEFRYDLGEVNVDGTVNGEKAEASSRHNEEVTLSYSFPKVVKHKHSPIKVDEVKATCKEEGKKAYYYCSECGKIFEDSKCTIDIYDVNTWGTIEKLEHTGGKATCDTRAICKNCGEYYGDLAEHNFGSTWDYKDALGHAHKCKVCGVIDTVIPHGGGTAKCGELAKCAECKTEYGEVMQHQWSKTPEYTDSKGHAYICTVCGDHDDIVKHSPGPEATETSSQNCTVCNYVITPAKQHKHTLTKVEKTDATCTTAGQEQHYVCDGCGKLFSDSKGNTEITDKDSLVIPAAGHKDSAWKSDADVHWKECTVKGCGELTVEKGSHEFNKAGKCTVCGYVSEDETDEPKTTDSAAEDDTTVPDEPGDTTEVNDPADDNESNAVMWIVLIASGVLAVACIAIVAIVLVKKNKKKS